MEKRGVITEATPCRKHVGLGACDCVQCSKQKTASGKQLTLFDVDKLAEEHNSGDS